MSGTASQSKADDDASEKRSLGKSQIEITISLMLMVRGPKLESPIKWREDSERDTFTLQARIGGHNCYWVLVGDAVENYIGDLDVRQAVESNLASHFVPR